MNILIAEDNFSDRLILKRIVETQGHTVFEAENGQVALEVFQQHKPDIILLDALMPLMDGFEVAKIVKSRSEDRFVPIIFITSLADTESLVRCIEAGGDDFFIKPFNKIILEAKIKAFGRAQELNKTVILQKEEIRFHNEHLIQEQKIAKRIFDNIAHKGVLDEPFIKYSISPMSIFNGDIVLAAKRPLGGVNILVGDFTGHGLPASIGAMPASEIFFGMTAKGFQLYEIIKELNFRLNNILPTGFFCCCFVAEVDFQEQTLRYINAGLPDAYISYKDQRELVELPSKHLPLGILPKSGFEPKIQLLNFHAGDNLIVFSDGVPEALNRYDEQFGVERVKNAVLMGSQKGDCFDSLLTELHDFQGEYAQDDDITIIQICPPAENQRVFNQSEFSFNSTEGASDSELTLRLGPESLKNFNPLPMFTQFLMEIGNLRHFRTQILTILTELYSNALEHGVLGLSSSLKRSSEGFVQYYQERESRLANLSEGWISIYLKHENSIDGGVLSMQFSDSGKGFDFQAVLKKKESEKLSGRGYQFIKKLAQSMEFSDNGSTVLVTFKSIVEG